MHAVRVHGTLFEVIAEDFAFEARRQTRLALTLARVGVCTHAGYVARYYRTS
jgi:hypothetical protein